MSRRAAGAVCGGRICGGAEIVLERAGLGVAGRVGFVAAFDVVGAVERPVLSQTQSEAAARHAPQGIPTAAGDAHFGGGHGRLALGGFGRAQLRCPPSNFLWKLH